MGFLDTVKTFLSVEPLQERSYPLATSFDYMPDLATQLANIRNYERGPWRAVSVTEALSVPAIWGAVNLIANVTGSMSMKALRNEVELPPQDRPRIIVRPDPFTIPREFFRSTAYNLASRGEAWWWVAMRDGDGLPVSLISVPPQEVTVEENPRDLRYPIIKWRDKVMRNEDFRQLVLSREPGSLRGWGPLQACGTAISVAVEAQIWAANFFAGGNSALWVKTSIPLAGGTGEEDDETGLAESEVQRFLTEWMNKDSNTPRITDDTVEDIKELNLNPQGAQMLEARAYQNVEVATMFNMDAELLNAAVAGSSLTYQNIGQRFDNFIRMCLQPSYFEVIEQTISDFLTRSTVARFNTDFLTQADPLTRWNIYNAAVTVIGQEEAADMAREGEGLAPGDVENAPIPLAPPTAFPSAAAIQTRSDESRCQAIVAKRRSGVMQMATCNKLFPSEWDYCPRCKSPRIAA
jgi:HK97 family phage portal protein